MITRSSADGGRIEEKEIRMENEFEMQVDRTRIVVF